MTTVDADSTVQTILFNVSPPHGSDVDLDAWNYLECGDACGTAGEDGYWYNQAGVLGWTEWSEFYDYCETAAAACADLYDIEDYDGWTVSVYSACSDVTVPLGTTGDKFAVVFPDDEIALVVVN